eukprot:scpid63762/ scgid11010/ 
MAMHWPCDQEKKVRISAGTCKLVVPWRTENHFPSAFIEVVYFRPLAAAIHQRMALQYLPYKPCNTPLYNIQYPLQLIQAWSGKLSNAVTGVPRDILCVGQWGSFLGLKM